MAKHPDFTECQPRTPGHAWKRFADPDMPRPEYGVNVAFYCVRDCGTKKWVTYGPHLVILRQRYFWHPLYRFHKGERPSAEEMRAALLRKYQIPVPK